MTSTLIVHVTACENCPLYLRRGHDRRWCMHPAWSRRPDDRPAADTVIRDGGARLQRRHLPLASWCPLASERVTAQLATAATAPPPGES